MSMVKRDSTLSGPIFPWILNSWSDLLFFVGTPLLIIPLVSAARTRFTVEEISLYVVAFGATGHHLPGMLRAYGDRALFRRFRVRFIVAPVFLVTSCLLFAHWDLKGLTLIGATWGTWHALMQVYGFLRIYDAKFRSVDWLTTKLDFLMCFLWFALGLLHSPGRQQQWLDAFYQAGGPFLSPGVLHGVRSVVDLATVMITEAFLLNLLWRWSRGQPPSPVKLLLILTSFGFWWYAMVSLNNALMGVALFEIFHDVQYLAIVWAFNRKRAEQTETAGSFTRFLFRRSGTMTGLYVGLVFAYGLIGLSPEVITSESVKSTIFGLLLASGLLHFYYDGFIWKVRERSTRAGLGLQGGREKSFAGWRLIPAWAIHGSKWSLLVIPACFLRISEWRGAGSRIEQLRNLVQLVPESWSAHYKLGYELAQQGRLDQAVQHLRRTVKLNPNNAEIHNALGTAYRQTDYLVLASKHFQRAVDINPRFVDAQSNLGGALLDQGDVRGAEQCFRIVLRLAPENAAAHHGLGTVLARHNQATAAAEHFQHALRSDPDFVEAHNNLGLMLLKQNKVSDAAESFQNAIRLRADYAEAHNNLGVVCVKQGKMKAAIGHYRQAIRSDPDHLLAVNSLAWNLAICGDDSLRNGDEAIILAERLVRASNSLDPGFLNTLAAAYAETGRFDEAIANGEKAVQMAREVRQNQLVQQFVNCLEFYRRRQPYRDQSGF